MPEAVDFRSVFFRKELRKPPFCPLSFALSARVAQTSIAGLLSDAGALATAMLNSQELFRADAIVMPICRVLEAEAYGAIVEWQGDEAKVVASPLTKDNYVVDESAVSEITRRGHIPSVLDALSRLAKLKPHSVALIAGISGPLSLSLELAGGCDEKVARDVASRILKKLVPSYCETGIDALAVFEPELGSLSTNDLQWFPAAFRSIYNIAQHYHVRLILFTRAASSAHLEFAYSTGFDAVVGGGVEDCRLVADRRKKTFGASLGIDLLASASSAEVQTAIQECLRRAGNRGVFLTTEWDVPSSTPPKALRLAGESLDVVTAGG